jgi:hypothetical protein
VDRLTRAYENGDVDGLVALLAEDVLMTMPPIPLEYLGRELVARFLRTAIFRPGTACRPVPTRANGQPALVMYLPEKQSGTARATGVLVFTLAGSRVSAITRFDDTVLPRFEVPATLPGKHAAPSPPTAPKRRRDETPIIPHDQIPAVPKSAKVESGNGANRSRITHFSGVQDSQIVRRHPVHNSS